MFTGNLNTDSLILDELDDISLARMCGTNRDIRNRVCNEPYFQRRTYKWFPSTIVNKPEDVSWRSWYFNMADYKEILRRDHNFLFKTGDPEKYLEFINDNEEPHHVGLKHAAIMGYRDLVDYFISKDTTLDMLYMGLMGASMGGHRDLVDLFFRIGAQPLWINGALYNASIGGHKHLIDYFINEKRANKWNLGLEGASLGGHRELVDFFIRKGATNWPAAIVIAQSNGHHELAEYIASLYPGGVGPLFPPN